jgi:hypothetical protein
MFFRDGDIAIWKKDFCCHKRSQSTSISDLIDSTCLFRLATLMSDQTYMPSSPSSVYSLGLDYEQSQHKQELRDAREADMSPEEWQAAAEQRRLKRVKLGIESPNEYQREVFSSPFKQVLSPALKVAVERSRSPSPTPRRASMKSTQKTCRCVAMNLCFLRGFSQVIATLNHKDFWIHKPLPRKPSTL